jgi:acyl-CoA hydrolase
MAANLFLLLSSFFQPSMEIGLLVNTENPESGKMRLVCSAFFTFVAIGQDGNKVEVPPVIPESVDERHAYALAIERKVVLISFFSIHFFSF